MSIQYDLSKYNCLITGGVRGIGRAIVNLLCDSKANVYICDLNAEDVNTCVKSMRKNGYKIHGSACDVSKFENCKKLVKKVNDIFNSKLDILVNNAGMMLVKPALDNTSEDFRKIMETNLESVINMSKLCYPLLKKSMNGASIINIGSAAGGLRGHNLFSYYSMSKVGIRQFTASLAREWADDNIRVNCIAPGLIRTDMTVPLLQSKEFNDFILKSTPLERIGEPNEIANVCVFLCSQGASYVTGTTVIVDGGMTVLGNYYKLEDMF